MSQGHTQLHRAWVASKRHSQIQDQTFGAANELCTAGNRTYLEELIVVRDLLNSQSQVYNQITDLAAYNVGMKTGHLSEENLPSLRPFEDVRWCIREVLRNGKMTCK